MQQDWPSISGDGKSSVNRVLCGSWRGLRTSLTGIRSCCWRSQQQEDSLCAHMHEQILCPESLVRRRRSDRRTDGRHSLPDYLKPRTHQSLESPSFAGFIIACPFSSLQVRLLLSGKSNVSPSLEYSSVAKVSFS